MKALVFSILMVLSFNALAEDKKNFVLDNGLTVIQSKSAEGLFDIILKSESPLLAPDHKKFPEEGKERKEITAVTKGISCTKSILIDTATKTESAPEYACYIR